MLLQTCPYCGFPLINHSTGPTVTSATMGWSSNCCVITPISFKEEKVLDDKGMSAMWLHWVIPQRNLQPEVRRHARHYPNHPGPPTTPLHHARPRAHGHAFGHSPRRK